MQPIVRFYILQKNDAFSRLELVCRLVETAQAQKQQVYVLCEDKMMTQTLDDLLWTFKPEAFIPHLVEGAEQQEKVAVILAMPPARATQCDVFINLSLGKIDIPRGCQRIFEVVVQTPSVLTVTRARFKEYKMRGFSPQMVKI